MPYLIVTYDKPDYGRLRQQTRPEHLTFLELNKAKLLACGAKLDDRGASASARVKIPSFEDLLVTGLLGNGFRIAKNQFQ